MSGSGWGCYLSLSLLLFIFFYFFWGVIFVTNDLSFDCFCLPPFFVYVFPLTVFLMSSLNQFIFTLLASNLLSTPVIEQEKRKIYV
jgi:hypothetical protein